MRFSRQVVWLVLAGALLGASVVASRASIRVTRSREGTTPHCSTQPPGQVVVGIPFPLDDDDDPSSDAPGPGRGTLRPPPRVAHHPVVAGRAPVTTRNRPTPPHRKLPSPAGDDVPAH